MFVFHLRRGVRSRVDSRINDSLVSFAMMKGDNSAFQMLTTLMAEITPQPGIQAPVNDVPVLESVGNFEAHGEHTQHLLPIIKDLKKNHSRFRGIRLLSNIARNSPRPAFFEVHGRHQFMTQDE